MERLKELRRERNMTQKELGNLLGLSVSAISMYEQGLRDHDLITIKKLANLFNVSADEFIGRKVESEQELDEALEIRERIRRDPAYRMLFSAAQKATPEHLRAAAAMLKALEPPEE